MGIIHQTVDMGFSADTLTMELIVGLLDKVDPTLLQLIKRSF